MQTFELILLIICAYFLGAVPAAYVAVKLVYGVDIRDYGSGQVGGSNVFRSFSRWLGGAVGLYDAGKGALMVWIAHLLGLGIAEQTIIGAAAITGHNWSVFLHFNAGRGVATTLGVAFVLMPWTIFVFLAVVVLTLVTRASAIPVVAGIAALPLVSWFLGEPSSLTFGLLGLFILLMLRRLTAPRKDQSAHIGLGELLLARFLYDRDTFNAIDWRTHAPMDTGGKWEGKPGKK
jgi:acyl phosphate:glycerol-3-phosphate acyltransferase